MLSMVAYIVLLQSGHIDGCPTRAYLPIGFHYGNRRGDIDGEQVDNIVAMLVRISKSSINCLCQGANGLSSLRGPCGRSRVHMTAG